MSTSDKGFSKEEKAAMKERAKEMKAEARTNKDRAAGEKDLLSKITEMPDSDRIIAERVHAIVSANAPELMPKTWYGMPSYARDGKIVCFFQAAHKFGTRYATFGFNDSANLDDGDVWYVAFAIKHLTVSDEARIAELVKKAVS
jgi:uncharacterized protein YdhG (YjbR/CyaY superfamily)